MRPPPWICSPAAWSADPSPGTSSESSANALAQMRSYVRGPFKSSDVRVRDAAIPDQPHSLKLEFRRKPSSLHDSLRSHKSTLPLCLRTGSRPHRNTWPRLEPTMPSSRSARSFTPLLFHYFSIKSPVRHGDTLSILQPIGGEERATTPSPDLVDAIGLASAGRTGRRASR
jgi:hypothetical protein